MNPGEDRLNTGIVFTLPCVVKYYDDGWRTALFFKRGRDFVSLITMDGMAGQTVHIRRWMKSREKEFKQIHMGEIAYDPKRAAQHFLRAGSSLGLTKSAEEVLKAVLAEKSASVDDGNSVQTSGDDMANVSIDVNKKDYKVVKAASGRKSLDNGDAAAKLLRGKSLDETYDIAAKQLGETKLALKRKYGKLNEGMQRMNLGNRIRKVLNAKH